MMAIIIADTQQHFLKSHRQQDEKISGKLQHFQSVHVFEQNGEQINNVHTAKLS